MKWFNVFFPVASTVYICMAMFFTEAIPSMIFQEQTIDCTVVNATKTMNSIYNEPWAQDNAVINVYVKAKELENVPEQVFEIKLQDDVKIAKAMEYYKDGSVHKCLYVGGLANDIVKLDTYFMASNTMLFLQIVCSRIAIMSAFMYVFFAAVKKYFFDNNNNSLNKDKTN